MCMQSSWFSTSKTFECYYLFKYALIFYLCVIVRGSRPGKNVQLSESEIRGLCIKSRELFLNQPILLELEAPLKICGQLVGPVS